MRRASGVKPKASSGEGKFFRGVATTLKYGDFYATAFFSIRDIDATVSQADSLDEPELVSALQESGYHRTPHELAQRNAISATQGPPSKLASRPTTYDSGRHLS